MDAHERMASVSSMRTNRIDVNLNGVNYDEGRIRTDAGGDAEADGRGAAEYGDVARSRQLHLMVRYS